MNSDMTNLSCETTDDLLQGLGAPMSTNTTAASSGVFATITESSAEEEADKSCWLNPEEERKSNELPARTFKPASTSKSYSSMLTVRNIKPKLKTTCLKRKASDSSSRSRSPANGPQYRKQMQCNRLPEPKYSRYECQDAAISSCGPTCNSLGATATAPTSTSALISDQDVSDGAEDGKSASRPLLGALSANNNIFNMNNTRCNNDSGYLNCFSSPMSQQADASMLTENCNPFMQLPQPRMMQKAGSTGDEPCGRYSLLQRSRKPTKRPAQPVQTAKKACVNC